MVEFGSVLDGESSWIGVVQGIVHVYDQVFVVGEALGGSQQANSHLLFMEAPLLPVELEELL